MRCGHQYCGLTGLAVYYGKVHGLDQHGLKPCLVNDDLVKIKTTNFLWLVRKKLFYRFRVFFVYKLLDTIINFEYNYYEH